MAAQQQLADAVLVAAAAVAAAAAQQQQQQQQQRADAARSAEAAAAAQQRADTVRAAAAAVAPVATAVLRAPVTDAPAAVVGFSSALPAPAAAEAWACLSKPQCVIAAFAAHLTTLLHEEGVVDAEGVVDLAFLAHATPPFVAAAAACLKPAPRDRFLAVMRQRV